ncbi:MAG: Txe/YoeB family addiction module toxin [Sphingobacteriaceae bacterium]|nr:Txe/YoeB family addiction module toxin [Sphingobacteriaceae bacterium]
MAFDLDFTFQAKEEIEFHKKAGDKAVLKKLLKLLEEISEHPFEGTGKPEPLKYSLNGCWSRRINREHRLVYEVKESRVVILSVKGHYS